MTLSRTLPYTLQNYIRAFPFFTVCRYFAYHFIHFPAATKHFHVIQSFVILFGTGQEIHSRSNIQSLEIV